MIENSGENKHLLDDPGRKAVEETLATWRGPLTLLEEMEGGASTRRFFRIQRQKGTAVAMYIPAPSQEIAKSRQSAGGAPFVEVAELLEKASIPVPKIFERCDKQNVLLVEDLGEDTLARYLEKNPHDRLELYKMAVRDLAHAQRSLSPLPEDCIVKKRAFDEELLRWEVEHFKDWALEARGITLTDEDKKIFDKCASYLARTISEWQRGFVHRDYQSRNLMVRSRSTENGSTLSLTWIDFQDAMMGPRTYDLVALLTDSYQQFTTEFINDRLDEYCEILGIEEQRQLVGFEFDFLTVQRKLKDAGRFIFIDRVNKNPNFLPYVDSTIEKARAALQRVDSQGPLAEMNELLKKLLDK